MKIVTTPMCKDLLILAGVREFEVNIDPDSTMAEIAVVLSETDTKMKSVKVKLNTFSQIKDSVGMLSQLFNTKATTCIDEIYRRVDDDEKNRKIKVKVYSKFLSDIVDDLGFTVMTGNDHPEVDYHYLVYPDYMRDQIYKEVVTMGERAVELPSHKNMPKNPIERAEIRYKLLEKKLCTKP